AENDVTMSFGPRCSPNTLVLCRRGLWISLTTVDIGTDYYLCLLSQVAGETLAKYPQVSRSGGYLSAERAQPTLLDISPHNLFCPLADVGVESRCGAVV